MLRHLPLAQDARLVVGMNPADDAAVYRLPSGEGLVFTADFFTPIVDSPEDFGGIAAANALSDVYAMGGRPFLALNLVGFPLATLSHDVLGRILRGGADVAAEAGVLIGGGHSIDDAEPKYGMAVVGFVDPDAAWTKAGLRAGDRLFLTKALGTGIIATAHKRDQVEAPHLDAAVSSMRQLNRAAMEAGRASGVRAATDITGYGLLGHLLEMCRASHVGARLRFDALPILPGVHAYLDRGIVPGGTRRNLEDVADHVRFAPRLREADRLLCADAQTSGGLLLAVAPALAPDLAQALMRAGVIAAEIGEVTADARADGEGARIEIC